MDRIYRKKIDDLMVLTRWRKAATGRCVCQGGGGWRGGEVGIRQRDREGGWRGGRERYREGDDGFLAGRLESRRRWEGQYKAEVTGASFHSVSKIKGNNNPDNCGLLIAILLFFVYILLIYLRP